MKFFISEGNIGGQASKAQAEMVVAALKEKGWDVEYGTAENKVTDISEFGREEALHDDFAEAFMACIDALGI